MSESRILNSWKEISNYIGRGVRTVQRWEEFYGLPVHRPSGKDRSAVYALADEVDGWLKAGATHQEPAHAQRPLDPATREYCQQLLDRASDLREQLRGIRDSSTQLRQTVAEQFRRTQGIVRTSMQIQERRKLDHRNNEADRTSHKDEPKSSKASVRKAS